MSKVLTIVISAACGAALGGGAVYVYLNKKYEGIMEREMSAADEEIERLEKEVTRLQKQTADKLAKSKEDIKNAVIPEKDPNSLIFEEDENGDEVDITEDSSSNDIRFISMRDYEDDEDYEKEEFEYYMFDGTIVQDDEVLSVEEFEQVCGGLAMPLLRKDRSLARWSSGSDNELYIRNEEYCTDYKINRHHSAYAT